MARHIARVLGLALLGTMLVAGPASAAKPTMERIIVNDVFVDDFLSEACGTEVTVMITGSVIFRNWLDADGNDVRAVNNYALTDTFSSVNGSVRAKDVGADRVTLNEDGSITVIIIGNVQSISIPGQGRISQDVGRAKLTITFDENGDATEVFEPLGGKHDENGVEALCSVLG
jgi:hypothetical protein